MKQYLCKYCGGWHTEDNWPHNCSPPRNAMRADFATPSLHNKFEAYRSMVGDHRMITSRGERREDLKRNDCVEWHGSESEIPSQKGRTPGRYSNPYFAMKRGVPLNDTGEERIEAMRRDGRLEEFNRTKRKFKFPDRVKPGAGTP